MDWYSVDLPGITALRDEVLPADAQSHSVPVSLADPHWPDTIPADRPTILIADGLFAFLTEPAIVGIFRRITDHFGSGELAFNDYGRIGWVSRLAIKLYPQKMFKDVGSQWGYAGFKDAHHPETWNPRMTLVEEASLSTSRRSICFPAGSAWRPSYRANRKPAPARQGSCATGSRPLAEKRVQFI